MNFPDRLAKQVQKKKSCLLLGLDPRIDKMPKYFQHQSVQYFENGEVHSVVWAKLFTEFCLRMMVSCEPYIVGVKIQMAYFEVLGSHGMLAVEHLIRVAKEKDLIVVLDAKRGDIGSTCEAYSQAYIEDAPLSGDAVTVVPFLGSDTIDPFIKSAKKFGTGIFAMLRTSNPSSKEFQPAIEDALVKKFAEWGKSTVGKSGFSAVGAVVGATHPEQLVDFRKQLPHTWFLCPGVGAQGGKIEDVLKASVDGLGVLIPVSRAALYASDKDDFMEKGAKVMKGLYEEQKEVVG